MQRVVPTEYPDYPARAPLEFYGDEYRPEYVGVSEVTGEPIDFGDVLRKRAAYLGNNLATAVKMLLGELKTDFRFLENVVGDLIRTERVEKMLNYQKFFDFVFLLHQQKDQLANMAQTLPTSDKFKVLRVVSNIPVLTSHLRVTPMGPEPNQVNNMCTTQFDVGRTGAPQKEQCLNVYDMCRGKQDEFGKIDHTRDLLCARYIKKQVFPVESSTDPDVSKYFRNYNYARDNSEYLKQFVTQHDWQQEYKLGGKLNQWDISYADSKYGAINYADRGTRQSTNPNAFGDMIAARPQQAASYIASSQAAYDQQYAQQATVAANEARRKSIQLAQIYPDENRRKSMNPDQLRQGMLSPKLSPVKTSVVGRTQQEIISGFAPAQAIRVLPAPTRRMTPRRGGTR
jgi:hypothetical protein